MTPAAASLHPITYVERLAYLPNRFTPAFRCVVVLIREVAQFEAALDYMPLPPYLQGHQTKFFQRTVSNVVGPVKDEYVRVHWEATVMSTSHGSVGAK